MMTRLSNCQMFMMKSLSADSESYEGCVSIIQTKLTHTGILEIMNTHNLTWYACWSLNHIIQPNISTYINDNLSLGLADCLVRIAGVPVECLRLDLLPGCSDWGVREGVIIPPEATSKATKTKKRNLGQRMGEGFVRNA